MRISHIALIIATSLPLPTIWGWGAAGTSLSPIQLYPVVQRTAYPSQAMR